MRMYTVYVNNYDNGNATLVECKKRSQFNALIAVCPLAITIIINSKRKKESGSQTERRKRKRQTIKSRALQQISALS